MTHDLNQLMTDPELRRGYEKEALIGEFVAWVHDHLTNKKIQRQDLARMLGVSPSRVSQILAGTENLTLGSVADIGWALGVTFTLSARPWEAHYVAEDSLI